MRVIVLATLLTLMTAPAHAGNELKAQFSCAPWSGQSLSLTIGWPENTAYVNIWGDALTSLQNGSSKSVTIDNAEGSNGTGGAQICNTKAGKVCSVKNVTLDFTVLNLEVGGTLKGTIKLDLGDTAGIPFEGTLTGSHEICG